MLVLTVQEFRLVVTVLVQACLEVLQECWLVVTAHAVLEDDCVQLDEADNCVS